MWDEYMDVSDKKQLTFYMRWLNNDLEVFEKFLRFYEISDKKKQHYCNSYEGHIAKMSTKS